MMKNATKAVFGRFDYDALNGIVLTKRSICTLPTNADVRHQDSTFAITALFTLTFAPMTPVRSPCSYELERCQDCCSDEGLRSITNGSTQEPATGSAAVSARGHG